MTDTLPSPPKPKLGETTWLSVKEFADLIRVPVQTVYFWVQNNKLPDGITIKIGGRWRINKDLVQYHIEHNLPLTNDNAKEETTSTQGQDT